MASAVQAQMSSDLQPKPSKIPPVVPDFSSGAIFLADDVSALPCTVMSKLKSPIQLFTQGGHLQDVPANSRLLRISANPELSKESGRWSGCNFYEKITLKHRKLRCFMASTCLKPR